MTDLLTTTITKIIFWFVMNDQVLNQLEKNYKNIVEEANKREILKA